MNSICLLGRLTADPELRNTPNGISVTNFDVAVDRSYTPKGQEKQVDFIPVQAWRQTAEFVCKYFRKGQRIALQGSLQSRSYTDKDGNKRTSLTLANKILLQAGAGVLTIRDQNMEQFNEALLNYYNTAAAEPLKAFLYENAIQGLAL